MIGVLAAMFGTIIVVGCVLAAAYDVLAKKYGWPR